MNDLFRRFAHAVASAAGSPWASILALGTVLLWLASGPLFAYSDGWQLMINTGTTIVTFLMVFLIQNAQNRDARALHLKLDELIRGVQGARNHMVNLEECTDEELDRLRQEFQRLQHRARVNGPAPSPARAGEPGPAEPVAASAPSRSGGRRGRRGRPRPGSGARIVPRHRTGRAGPR
jgi:low affinity Fe/Cu permease